ncbi:hypothetical protein [Bradyrhizobium sp.]|uniref:hypothetical protein n=1 Tax=Bradyrhizobium sp. TaxID=376 RepID=UPI0025B99305|nr:hypothetical protein [Bradyrhizobium sp.]
MTGQIARDATFLHYGLPAAPLPSVAVARSPHRVNINHPAKVPRPGHFVDGSKG